MLKHIYRSSHTQSIQDVHVMLPKLAQTAVAGQFNDEYTTED